MPARAQAPGTVAEWHDGQVRLRPPVPAAPESHRAAFDLTPWQAMTMANALAFVASTAPTFRTCTTCGAPYVFGITGKGRNMPLDPGDHPEGNMVAWMNGGKLYVRGHKAGEELPPDHHRVVPHFATCKHADAHRKRR